MDRSPPASTTPWLSLLLPVYNVEAYVGACVESILGQWIEGVEVLLVDDASRDGSAEVVRRLVERHPGRLRAWTLERNGGLSATRNVLLGHARGDYVWFLDSDDVLLEGALASLHRIVAASAPDLVMCDFRLLRERQHLKHRLRGENHRATFAGPSGRVLDDPDALVEGLLARGQLHSWSKIARRAAWARARFPEGRCYEDIATTAPLLAAVRTFVHVAEPWVGYRQRPGSIMNTMDAGKMVQLADSIADLRRGLAGGTPPLSPGARFAADYFCMKTYASLGRRILRTRNVDPAVRAACGARFRAAFPDGAAPVLAAYRRRGWWWRAWRTRRALSALGWS